MIKLSESSILELQSRLEKHEGFSRLAYKDSLGNLTIGIGRCLNKRGITHDEALYLLNNDIVSAQKDIHQFLPQLEFLDEPRMLVLIEMVFNLGIEGVIKFQKMIKALIDKNYKLAAKEMLDSAWSKQVGNRAQNLAYKMRVGI